MKLLDEKGKLFGKINLLDACVIVLVLLLLGGAYYKFRILDKTSAGTAMVPIQYTVEVKRIRPFIEQNVQPGDTLFDKVSGNAIGTITKVEVRQATEPVNMEDGSVQIGEVENRVDAVLSVEAEGVINEKGHFVNKTYELVVGSDRKFMNKYFECTASVKDIE